MNLISKLFLSSRPISWVNTAFPFAAAYFFSTGRIDWVLVIGALFFLVPYNLLMYGVNDVFDYESDLRNPRKGGIEGALLDPKFHRPTLLISFGFAAPFALVLSTVNLWGAVLLWVTLFFVVAYSLKGLRFKEVPFLDSFTSAFHFVGPMLVGIAMAGQQFTAPLVLATVAFMLWGMASHAFGAVQDVKADRAANIASVATKLGARNTVRFALVLYVFAMALGALLPENFSFVGVALVPYLIVVGSQLKVTDETCEDANRGWRYFIWLNYFVGAIVCSLLIGPQ